MLVQKYKADQSGIEVLMDYENFPFKKEDSRFSHNSMQTSLIQQSNEPI